MEGYIDIDSVLDYAVFQISPTKNSYEAFVCNEGKIEKLVCGPLDKLALHLPQAEAFQSNSSDGSFKLQLSKSFEGLTWTWFTKFTLARFLHIINSHEAIKTANQIANEISQLEDSRIFHYTLYSEDQSKYHGETMSALSGGRLKDVGLTQDINAREGPSDSTRSELLRAMELRLVVLKGELVACLKRAVGSTLSVKHISDLTAFAQHFEVRELRDPLLICLSLIPEDQAAESLSEKMFSDDTRKDTQDTVDEICSPTPTPYFPQQAIFSNGIFPAKIARAERQSSTESEKSSESNDEDQPFTEKSKTALGSVTLRRSSSPMRRIQIGRCGSRRSPALTIKSLNYFPARERLFRDDDESNSGDEVKNYLARKPEVRTRRISVQETISLFENKQRDLDAQTRRTSGEVSLGANKAVLRRWSSAMSVSPTSSPEFSCESVCPNTCLNLVSEAVNNRLTDVKDESDAHPDTLNPTACGKPKMIPLPEANMSIIPSKDSASELLTSQAEETDGGETASAELSRMKEEELHQKLTKMMESSPDRSQVTNVGPGRSMGSSSDQRGGFYRQYKQKRDDKLRAENAKKRSIMEAQLKVFQETLQQNKSEMASKSKVTSQKLDRPSNGQPPRRNLSPSLLQKKEFPKATASVKVLSKSSTLPTTRSSWSPGTLQRTSEARPAKTSPRMTPANTAHSRWKSQPLPSMTSPSTKTDRPLHQPKSKPEARIEPKPSIKGQGENNQKTTKTKKILKSKAPLASGDDSDSTAARPSLYNKVKKKSSVVPLETKPLKKGTRTGSGVGSVLTRSKVDQTDDVSKRSSNITQAEKSKAEIAELTEPKSETAGTNESKAETAELTAKEVEVDLAQQANDVDEKLDTSLDNDLNVEKSENQDQGVLEVDDGSSNSVEIPLADIQLDEEIGISSVAWVEVEHQEVSTANDTGSSEPSVSTVDVSRPQSSPHAEHSLSQMLQNDSNEPDIIEWGNTENPPAIIHHKDSPKGLKRLLKFARKSKGHVTNRASSSIFFGGEDVLEDSKASKMKSTNIMRKVALEHSGPHDVPSGHEVQVSRATSTKSRSFFSLSTFRSNKSSGSK